MSKKISLAGLLKNKKAFKTDDKEDLQKQIEKLQLKMLRIQQGIWQNKGRVMIMLEGFDAAGKGGAIHKLTEMLDPRSYTVHPIGPPKEEEHGKHWLFRFWARLPEPGTIAIFDRSWYGRVLVERVDKLTDKKNWHRAFEEINQFEAMLANDGIIVIKIFLGIHKDEQLKRFEERLNNPYKQWKISEADILARKQWDQYVKAVDAVFLKTNSKLVPWHLVAADSKSHARLETLKIVTKELKSYEHWMEKKAAKLVQKDLKADLKKLS